MSYFTASSSEYDLPHPTLNTRHQPRFYIPSVYSPSGHSSHATFPSESFTHSRHHSIRSTSTPQSGRSTPFYSSGTSLAALRQALHTYQPHHHAHPPYGYEGEDASISGDYRPMTPPRQYSRTLAINRPPNPVPPSTTDRSGIEFNAEYLGEESDDEVPWADDGVSISGDPMEALIDIHRVLYRGTEGSEQPSWPEQGKEVKRVVDQWFESDVIYDHPLVRLSSRQTVLTHFALLQLLSTAYLPSLTPSSLIHHARGLTSRVRGALLGSDDVPTAQVASGGSEEKRIVDHTLQEWLESSASPSQVRRHREDPNGWWKLWDVTAECRDLGCMECYEGYHLALIDHVVTLTLFPSLSRRAGPSITPSESSCSLPSLAVSAPRSFLRTLASAVVSEFDYFLHWDLPISTIVEFNEVGKATHVRDVVDVRDVIDTFVPFAKRFNWLSRRVAGLVSSTVGSMALALLPSYSVVIGDALRIVAETPGIENAERVGKGKEKMKDEDSCEKDIEFPQKLGSAIGLDSAIEFEGLFRRHKYPNLLGLEGMSTTSVAPDVDNTAVSQDD